MVLPPNFSRAHGRNSPVSEKIFPSSTVTFNVVVCLWGRKVSRVIQFFPSHFFFKVVMVSPMVFTIALFAPNQSSSNDRARRFPFPSVRFCIVRERLWCHLWLQQWYDQCYCGHESTVPFFLLMLYQTLWHLIPSSSFWCWKRSWLYWFAIFCCICMVVPDLKHKEWFPSFHCNQCELLSKLGQPSFDLGLYYKPLGWRAWRFGKNSLIASLLIGNSISNLLEGGY